MGPGTDTGHDRTTPFALDQRQVGAKILVKNRHALDDNAWQKAFTSPLVGPQSDGDDDSDGADSTA